MIIDMGQNNTIYGVLVFYIPDKGRRKKKRKKFGEGKYIFVEEKEKEKTIILRRRLITEKEQEQGCIICAILPSGMGARGVSSEHVENMETFSCSSTLGAL